MVCLLGTRTPPPIPISVYRPVFYDAVLFHWLVSSMKWSGYCASSYVHKHATARGLGHAPPLPPPPPSSPENFWNLEIMRLLLLEPFLVKTMHAFWWPDNRLLHTRISTFSAHCAIQHYSFGFPIVR